MKIKYLTFEIISRCNMDCKFCFSNWRNHVNEMGTKRIKNILNIMKKKGLETVSFTGGEPLLRKDILEILKHAKKIGLTTILTTNGLLLKKKIPKIAKYIDFIGLPLDSPKNQIHNKMRISKHKNHFRLILELIELLHKKYSQIGIKINTVVSKKNKKDLAKIGDLINGKVVSWKLSCFVPGAFGKNYKDAFMISDLEYEEIVNKCKKRNKNINIIYSKAYSRDAACRVLSCDGYLLEPCKDIFINLGRVEEIDDKKMKKNFDFKKSEYFLYKTYPKTKK